ncbi:MAG: pseudouridine synthase [Bacteroidota bacterium]|jgi:23S rRNA pseudouridine955/2504/2580 synthase/23S rRNA pseudouridine1911/1915/1917 synthase
MKPAKIQVVYQDDAIVIVNKPAGILSIPDRFNLQLVNIYHFLKEEYGDKIYIVHRLDRDTSGILCFARTEEAHRELSRQWQERTVDKTYCVLVQGTILQEAGRIENYLGEHPGIPGRMVVTKRDGKKSITEWRVTERFKNYTLVAADIKTGRQHQIRVHFTDMGHPLAIDPMYAKRESMFLSEIKTRKYKASKEDDEAPLMSRMTLHAHQLSFLHPETQEKVGFEAELPKDFAAILNQLRKHGKAK